MGREAKTNPEGGGILISVPMGNIICFLPGKERCVSERVRSVHVWITARVNIRMVGGGWWEYQDVVSDAYFANMTTIKSGDVFHFVTHSCSSSTCATSTFDQDGLDLAIRIHSNKVDINILCRILSHLHLHHRTPLLQTIHQLYLWHDTSLGYDSATRGTHLDEFVIFYAREHARLENTARYIYFGQNGDERCCILYTLHGLPPNGHHTKSARQTTPMAHQTFLSHVSLWSRIYPRHHFDGLSAYFAPLNTPPSSLLHPPPHLISDLERSARCCRYEH